MSDSEDSESGGKRRDSVATVEYVVVNNLHRILQEMKIPNTVRQRANDLLVQEGFHALFDVNNVTQDTWDGFFDEYVDDEALFNVLDSLRPAQNSVKIVLFRRRPGWKRDEERGTPRSAQIADRESSGKIQIIGVTFATGHNSSDDEGCHLRLV